MADGAKKMTKKTIPKKKSNSGGAIPAPGGRSPASTGSARKGKRGGARPGAGRKVMGEVPKKTKSLKLDVSAINRLSELSAESGHPQNQIVEYLLKKVKKLPNKLE